MAEAAWASDSNPEEIAIKTYKANLEMRHYTLYIYICATLLLCFFPPQRIGAQCSIVNTAVQPGESLTYQLYFNWKFVWMKAGSAIWSTTTTTWNGKEAFQSHLLTMTSGKVDKFFMMRDTLQSIISCDMVPWYYKKAANEGNKYYVDQLWYSYPEGKTALRQEYLNRQGVKTYGQTTRPDCVYDMMSMMMRARSFDASKFKEGEKMEFPMADGHKVEDITLIYRGKRNFKMKSTGVTYRCLVFSVVEYDRKKENEVITFYISDDKNHIPVRLDLFLKFGTAKAYLSKATGLRNPSTSIIEE